MALSGGDQGNNGMHETAVCGPSETPRKSAGPNSQPTRTRSNAGSITGLRYSHLASLPHLPLFSASAGALAVGISRSDGDERPFPKGFPVTAVAKDGTSRRSRVGDDGKLRIVMDRPSGGFFLQFNSNGHLHFASAAPGSTAAPQDKLIGDDDVEDAVKQGFRFFQVPDQWSTQDQIGQRMRVGGSRSSHSHHG